MQKAKFAAVPLPMAIENRAMLQEKAQKSHVGCLHVWHKTCMEKTKACQAKHGWRCWRARHWKMWWNYRNFHFSQACEEMLKTQKLKKQKHHIVLAKSCNLAVCPSRMTMRNAEARGWKGGSPLTAWTCCVSAWKNTRKGCTRMQMDPCKKEVLDFFALATWKVKHKAWLCVQSCAFWVIACDDQILQQCLRL